jgi:SAM-dependent methyltransferase
LIVNGAVCRPAGVAAFLFARNLVEESAAGNLSWRLMLAMPLLAPAQPPTAGLYSGPMQHKPVNLYDYPRYYDLVFGSDWKAEFDFLREAFDQFATGQVRRIFEPACGTGRLLFRLGAVGYDVSGLDLNPRAVEYCNKRLLRHGLGTGVFVGDMSDFRLPRKVDAAFNMINSFRHLLSEESARKHLQCMAAALRKGGVYVLGLHLTPTEGVPLAEESWSARRGHLAINTHLETFDLDLKRRAERCTMRMDIYTPKNSFQIVDELVFRTYTRGQLKSLLASVPELEAAAAFDFSYNLDNSIEIEATTQDVVLMLRKR